MTGQFGLREDTTGAYLHYSLCNLRAIQMFLTGQIEMMAFKIQVVCLCQGSADILLVIMW